MCLPSSLSHSLAQWSEHSHQAEEPLVLKYPFPKRVHAHFHFIKSAFCEQPHTPTTGLPTTIAGHFGITVLYVSAQLIFVSTASNSTPTDMFFPQVLSDTHFRWNKANTKPDKGSPLLDHPASLSIT